MPARTIITYPDRRLRTPTRPLPKELGNELSSSDCSESRVIGMLRDMEDTLIVSESGLALAANQVGIEWSLVVAREDDGFVWAANPEIVDSDGLTTMSEACLSFPGYGPVMRQRWEHVTVGFDLLAVSSAGRLIRTYTQEACSGLQAQMWQHEHDHLMGRLFVDDLPERERTRIAERIVRRKGRK